MRANNRQNDQLREIHIETNYIHNRPGDVLICFGNTKVICSASIADGVPRFLKGQHKGWVTAEYGMLPSATNSRTQREAAKGKQTGRTMEIQRLIARSLRNCVNLKELKDYTITVDCDVIQADGGTRTAAITGSCIALANLINHQIKLNVLKVNPIKYMIASVSVGIVKGEALLDLDYSEDSKADTDLNVVMTDSGSFIEIQGTAEGDAFSGDELNAMLAHAKTGITELLTKQTEALTKSE